MLTAEQLRFYREMHGKYVHAGTLLDHIDAQAERICDLEAAVIRQRAIHLSGHKVTRHLLNSIPLRAITAAQERRLSRVGRHRLSERREKEC